MIRYKINDSEYKERLDNSVTLHIEGISRSFAQNLIEKDKVTVNGQIEKTGYKLRIGDKIQIDYDQKEHEKIPEIELPILYEDDDCIVINKPEGILTHSKGAFNPEATVSTFVQSRAINLSGDRAGIVHRLDRATSGVMIAAKNPEALSWLQKQFSQRKVKKTYRAVVKGQPEPPEAIIDMPIERNPKKPQTFRVGANGKQAITQYKIIATDGMHSLLELSPTTGRTHQLRVHLLKLGHPIVGDTLYNGEPSKRLFLHAQSLEITMPSRKREIFMAPMPEEFNELIKV